MEDVIDGGLAGRSKLRIERHPYSVIPDIEEDETTAHRRPSLLRSSVNDA